jgi:cell division protein FtsQ
VVPRTPLALPWRGLGASLIGLLLVGALGWGAYLALDPAVVPVRYVHIRGRLEHVTESEIKQALSGHLTRSLFALDVVAIRQNLASLPWVRSVSVRRVWPDRLEVTVHERTAIARWGKDRLLGPDGEPFRVPSATVPKGLPLWEGPDGTQRTVAERYRRMTAAIRPLGRSIARLTRDERGAWSLELDNGLDLDLGRKQEMERLARFVRVYPLALAGHVERIETVDLRYRSGFAVRWRSGQTTTTDARTQKA